MSSELKRIVPRALWVGGRRAANYVRRLRHWRAVVREVHGVTLDDTAIIQRSVRAGVRGAGSDLDRWRDPVLIADATVRLAGIGEFAIRGQSDDLFAVLPSRERAVVAAFRTHLKSGSTFIDAGANIGFFTILAARLVGPAGRVIAIEMMPDTAVQLRANVDRNGLSNVTIVEHALSNRSGEEVVATMPEDQFARASIAGATIRGGRQVRVRTKTLDDLLAGFPEEIDLIKMDLEGAEAMAIEGAGEVLARTRAVIFEQLEGDAAGRLLASGGFALRMLDANNLLAARVMP
ncbi:FkbM family methyltransferase [Sphingomonas sp. URHD0057]|uniref:FkbM family methyltransferase n=1 Tax=Sphingomonas sp. URHD0057 TaxID=1380389 RepID=UPI0006844398|nr:FkbM family methyltransferase [Sphingomonas sp. URHD0057]